MAVHLRNFQCHPCIHECCRFVESQGAFEKLYSSWFEISFMNILSQAALGSLLVPRICKSRWENKQQMTESSGGCPVFYLAQLWTHLLVILVPSLELPRFIILPSFGIQPICTIRNFPREIRDSVGEIGCIPLQSAFTFLLGRICNCLSLRVFWTSWLRGNDCCCWRNPLWKCFANLINHSLCSCISPTQL